MGVDVILALPITVKEAKEVESSIFTCCELVTCAPAFFALLPESFVETITVNSILSGAECSRG
jgi:hypothetical protein